VHLVGYFHSCITMHGFMNVNQITQNLNYVLFIHKAHCDVNEHPKWKFVFFVGVSVCVGHPKGKLAERLIIQQTANQ
jgi:hypothetical protein